MNVTKWLEALKERASKVKVFERSDGLMFVGIDAERAQCEKCLGMVPIDKLEEHTCMSWWRTDAH